MLCVAVALHATPKRVAQRRGYRRRRHVSRRGAEAQRWYPCPPALSRPRTWTLDIPCWVLDIRLLFPGSTLCVAVALHATPKRVAQRPSYTARAGPGPILRRSGFEGQAGRAPRGLRRLAAQRCGYRRRHVSRRGAESQRWFASSGPLSSSFSLPSVGAADGADRVQSKNSSVHGRPRRPSSTMNGSGSKSSTLNTPAPFHVPVTSIMAPIMAGTPVV